MPDLILNKDGEVVATLHHVTFDKVCNAWLGDIAFVAAPLGLQQLLERLEELVEDQVFSLVDEVQASVDAYELTVRFSDGGSLRIYDLYVSKSGGFSFRVDR